MQLESPHRLHTSALLRSDICSAIPRKRAVIGVRIVGGANGTAGRAGRLVECADIGNPVEVKGVADRIVGAVAETLRLRCDAVLDNRDLLRSGSYNPLPADHVKFAVEGAAWKGRGLCQRMRNTAKRWVPSFWTTAGSGNHQWMRKGETYRHAEFRHYRQELEVLHRLCLSLWWRLW